jgi:hypothetical protein
VAGVAKATDLELFIRQIRDYGLFSNRTMLALSAWGIIAVECTLGVALLVAYRPRLMVPLAGGLLLLFLGATGWAWATGATEDCGCFGAWAKRTPAEAVVEDVILLAALALAWVGFKRKESPKGRGKGWAVALACLVGIALPLIFGFPLSAISHPQSKTLGVTLGDLKVQGLDVDLTRGEYLIVLIDADCTHCQESVPQLNELANASDLPPLVALCKNEEWKRMFFAQQFQTAFPIGQVNDKDFMRLLAAGDTPRLMLVRDRQVKQVWDKTIPNKAEIQSARRAS